MNVLGPNGSRSAVIVETCLECMSIETVQLLVWEEARAASSPTQ